MLMSRILRRLDSALVPRLELGNLCSLTGCCRPSGFASSSLGTRGRRGPRDYFPKVRDGQDILCGAISSADELGKRTERIYHRLAAEFEKAQPPEFLRIQLLAECPERALLDC